MESNTSAWVLLGITAICWLLGIWLPIVELVPFPVLRGQELPSFVDISGYGNLDEPINKSTLSTLLLLHERKFTFAFAIFLTSSIVIPFLKLLAACLVLLDRDILPPKVITVLAKLSTYQLVDLYVGILFVSFCNSDVFAAHVRIGFYLFALYCVLSIILMLTLEARFDAAITRIIPTRNDHELFAATEYQLAPNAVEKKQTKMLEGDLSTAFWNGLVFFLLVFYGNKEPILDTAFTFNGIALSRTTLGLLDLLNRVSQHTNPVVCMLVVSTAIGAPLLVSVLAVVGSVLHRYGYEEFSANSLALSYAAAKWVTVDVMALSLVSFLFAVQGDHLHTTIPDGTAFGITTDWFSGFYVCLALGAAGITLKLKAVHWHHDNDDEPPVVSELTTESLLAQHAQVNSATGQPKYVAVPLSDVDQSIDGLSQVSGTPSTLANPNNIASPHSEYRPTCIDQVPDGPSRSDSGALESGSCIEPPSSENRVAKGDSDDVVQESVASYFDDKRVPPLHETARAQTEVLAKAASENVAQESVIAFSYDKEVPSSHGEPHVLRDEATNLQTKIANSGSDDVVQEVDTPSLDDKETPSLHAEPPDHRDEVPHSQNKILGKDINDDVVPESIIASCDVKEGASSHDKTHEGSDFTDVHVSCQKETGHDDVVQEHVSQANKLDAHLQNVERETIKIDEAAIGEKTSPSLDITQDTTLEAPLEDTANFEDTLVSNTFASSSASVYVKEEPSPSSDNIQDTAVVGETHVPSIAPQASAATKKKGVAALLKGLRSGEVSKIVDKMEASADDTADLEHKLVSSAVESGLSAPSIDPSREVAVCPSPEIVEKTQDAEEKMRQKLEARKAAVEESCNLQFEERDVEMAIPTVPRETQEDSNHGMVPPVATGTKHPTPNSKCNRLLSNPIFHVKVASWVIWGLCYFCVKGPEKLTYMKMNHALEGVLPLLNSVINHTLPRTIGDCRESGLAPKPCAGTGPIYKGNTSGIGMQSIEEQRVLARWVTGVNTVRLDSISLQVIPDSSKPIEVGIHGEVLDLKMSIRIQQCLLGACRTVWDNVGGCCKPRRQFKLVIATDCVDSDAGKATLGSFKVEWFNIDDITLSENILGFFKQE